MEYTAKIRALLDKMETMKPSAIMALCGYTPQNQKYLGKGHFRCTCPFPGHVDRKIGSFDLNDERRIAKCFACGLGGRPVRFYRDLNCLTSDYEAAILMAESFGEIGHDDAQRLLGKNTASQKKPVKIAIPTDTTPAYQEVRMKHINVRSAFYTELVSHLPLNDRDRRYLLEARGLTEKDLSNFFSFEKDNVREVFEKTQRILGWEHERYIGIPGVYESFSSEEDARAKKDPHLRFGRFDKLIGERLGIVIRDIRGRVVGLQFRKYQAEGANRYSWISSAFANEDKFPLFANGRSGNSLVDFEPAVGAVCQTIGVTEGNGYEK